MEKYSKRRGEGKRRGQAAVKVGGVAVVAEVTVLFIVKTSRCLGLGLCACLS